jgi:hypothetical protein
MSEKKIRCQSCFSDRVKARSEFIGVCGECGALRSLMYNGVEMTGLEKLIGFLTVLSKYNKDQYPTDCHDGYFFVKQDISTISDEDLAKILNFEFIIDEKNGGFGSYHFGNCLDQEGRFIK